VHPEQPEVSNLWGKFWQIPSFKEELEKFQPEERAAKTILSPPSEGSTAHDDDSISDENEKLEHFPHVSSNSTSFCSASLHFSGIFCSSHLGNEWKIKWTSKLHPRNISSRLSLGRAFFLVLYSGQMGNDDGMNIKIFSALLSQIKNVSCLDGIGMGGSLWVAGSNMMMNWLIFIEHYQIR